MYGCKWPSAPPFFERRQFLARFAGTDGPTGPVQIALGYPFLTPGDIVVHGDGAVSAADEFFCEAQRLETLPDRVLLRALGWADVSGARSERDLDWVRRPSAGP
ncbi:MAG: hypothetical protein AAGI91_13270 [Bacteroidota bacterium]